MKLKEGFVLCEAGGEHMAVATGKALDSLNGMIRSNESADFIFHLLLKETTEEEIVQAMTARYEVSPQILSQDVHSLILKLRAEGLLDE